MNEEEIKKEFIEKIAKSALENYDYTKLIDALKKNHPDVNINREFVKTLIELLAYTWADGFVNGELDMAKMLFDEYPLLGLMVPDKSEDK